MGKVLLRMSQIKLDHASDTQEESKIADESDIGNFKTAYIHSFYSQAARYFKQALHLSLNLCKVRELRDSSYFLSLIYS